MVRIRAFLLAATFLALAAIHGTWGFAAGTSDQDNRPPPQSVEALAAGIEHEDPAAALELSNRLWAAGRKDDAVFFFYLGQLRFRAHLLSDPKRDRSLFDALMAAMGPPINQYAFGDIKALIATLDRVIAWDEAHADDYATREGREAAKAGLKKMRGDVLARQDEIRRNRSEKGLPNSP